MEKLIKFNPAKKRSVLLLNLNNEECHWEAQFSAFNWHCIHATSVAQTIKHIHKYDIDVAIALISSSYQQVVFKALTRLHEVKSSILWIAISSDNQFTQYPQTHQFPTYFIDYHHQPLDWTKLSHTLGHAHGMAALQLEKAEELNNPQDNHVILGKSTTIRQLKNSLEKIARAEGAVLISGETGTGKGLSAHLIHAKSSRKNGPFITINCGALPASLIHSELFGHERGAFTGAEKLYIGHIEKANKGTLFLDEIGDLSLESQVNLLQFIEEHTIERLGGSQTITIDCRIIFASHVNLEAAIDEGRFREDLYHRLNILRIHVPSLREYREDIELLANEYLRIYQQGNNKLILSPAALEIMLRYEWPGNVRELKNRIQRAVVMAEGKLIYPTDLGIKIVNYQSQQLDLVQHRLEIDTEVLLDAIKRNSHNISAAARDLNISRTTFYRLIKKCKIKL